MNPASQSERKVIAGYPTSFDTATGLRAVIFDVDGTLAETELAGHRVAFNRAFREFGLDWNWTPELYGELLAVTGGKERIRLYAQDYDKKMLKQADFDTWVACLHQRKSELYSELVLSGAIPLRPGITRLIQELHADGIRTAIATTTTPSGLHSLILANFKAEMTTLFEAIGAGDRVAKKKPAPDVYHWVLRQMDLPPEACLAIEDSYPGLAAARAAGIPTIITVNAYTADQNFDGALSIVSDLGEPDAAACHMGGLPLERGMVDLRQLSSWHQQHLAALPKPNRPNNLAAGMSAASATETNPSPNYGEHHGPIESLRRP